MPFFFRNRLIRPVGGLLVLFAALAAPGCGEEATGPTSPSPSGPAAVTAYLEEVVRTMQAESANSRAIDWTRFRAEVLAAAGTAPQTIQDSYPAIELALRSLNDFESHYTASTGRLIGPGLGGCTLSPAILSSLPETIGYVRVAGCPCQGPAADAYAEELQRAIRTADRPGLIGWIVDLREDGGGNMWPMMAGLGPILGEGIMGWIVYNNREYEREYRGGAAISLGEPSARVAVPYTLLEPGPEGRRADRRRDEQRRGGDRRLVQGASGHAVIRHSHLWASSPARFVSPE